MQRNSLYVLSAPNQTQKLSRKKGLNSSTALPAALNLLSNTEFKMYLKIHKSYRNVVAICDADLIGKIFEEGKKQLDCRENFYKDKKVTKEEAVKILQKLSNEDSTFNIIGQKSIEAAIEAGIITKNDFATVNNIPFTLIFL